MIDRAAFLGTIGALPLGQLLPNYATQLSIGVVGPFSGPDRRSGEAMGNGVRAAVNDYNNTRFSTDKIFAIRTFDDHNQVRDALINAQFATADPTIIAVIGHLGAQGTLNALRTYAEAQMPLLVPGVTDDALTAQGYQTVFRLPTRDADEGRLLAQYVQRTVKPKTPLACISDGDYGPGVGNGYMRGMQAAKIDAKSVSVTGDTPDYDGIASAVVGAAPDHVMFAGTVARLGPLLVALRARGYTGPTAACQGFFDATTSTKYAKEAEGIIISSSMPYLALAPSTTQMVSDFQLRFGPLVPISAFSYAAAQIVFSAVRRTGATARNLLARALEQPGNSYSTLAGNFQFSASGDTFDPQLYFYTVTGGNFSYVRQSHPSSFLSH